MENYMDIFGQALLSYFNGNKDAVLVMHTEGREPYELPVSIFYRPADYFTIDKMALSLCRGKVLDIGSGSGEHSLYLQKNGFDVTALDVSAHACDIMKNRGVNSIVHRDIFEEGFYTSFDTWLLLGRSIGAVGTFSKLVSFLELAHKNISATGQIILNSINTNDKSPTTRKISFEFFGIKGSTVDWLDIDQISLCNAAKCCGFTTDIVRTEEDGNYLAVLQRIES